MSRIIILPLFVLLAACSREINVFSDHDPDYDLWVYKTFDWGQHVNIEEGKNPFHYNELNDKRIKAAVHEQMSARGYQLTADAPDLILHYHIIVEDKSVLTTEPFGYQYSPYWERTHTNIYSYREGTLILDLMDSKTKNLIWRGWAVTEVSGIDPQKIDKLIKTTVAKIFKKYPKTVHKSLTSKELVLN